MILKAYAKINLGLRILGKRPDGYHDIETIFHRVDIFDEITLSPSSTISFASSSQELPTDERNLCVSAAYAFQKKFNVMNGIQIELKKNIPIGAGLGGGSSDAAAVLLGLNQSWNVKAPHEMLHSLALTLGSDVPYFLQQGSAHATGKGEILDYFTLNVPYWLVIIFPNVHISTEWAYKNAGERLEVRGLSLKDVATENINDLQKLSTLVHNDFEELVFKSFPAIADVKQQLYKLGAGFAQLSGSGSSVYGLFQEESQAKAATQEFEKNYRAFLTPPNFQY